MSSDLIPSRDRSLSRQSRQEAAAVRSAQLPARRAAALAAHTGLICVETLTAVEAQAVKRQGATLDLRATAIVDTFAGLVTTEIARLSLGD